MKHLILFMAMAFSVTVAAQTPTWTQMPDFPGGQRFGGFSFAIGNKIYMGAGSLNNDLWEFDTQTLVWTQKASIPYDITPNYATTFVINGYGYLLHNRVYYRYDPATDSWMRRGLNIQPQIPGNINYVFAGAGASSFVIGSKAYIVTGVTSHRYCQPTATRRLYEFDPVTNIWTRKADFPGHARVRGTGFALNGKGYVGTGYYEHPGSSHPIHGSCPERYYTYADFYRYDPAANIWQAIENYPGGQQFGMTSFVVNETAYVGVGDINGGTYYTYNELTSWSPASNYPGVTSNYAVSAVIGQKAYFGALANVTPQVWEFGPENPDAGIEITGIIHPAPFCSLQNTTFELDFQAVGSFEPENVFTVQLSDVTGGFNTPLDIGMYQTDGATGSVSCTLPSGLADGNYSIRLVSSTPQFSHTAAHTILVTSNLPGPILSSQQRCIGSTIAELSTDLQTVIWYENIDSTIALAEETLLSTGTYYASMMHGSCETQKVPVNINIIDLPAPPALSITVCHGSGTWNASEQIPGSGEKWYTALDSTVPMGNQSLEETTYYVSYASEGCEGPRSPITISLYEPVMAPAIQDTEICASAWLSDIYPQEDLFWFDSAQGNNIFDPSTRLIYETRTYYVAYRSDDMCWSARVPVTITSLRPPAPTGDAIQVMSGTNPTVANLVANGENIEWFASSSQAFSGNSPLPLTTPIQLGTTYYATQEINGCRGSSSLAVTVTGSLSTNENDLAHLRLWPNPVSGQLNFEFNVAVTGISIYNMLGQEVYNEKLADIVKGALNLSTIAPGTYIIKLVSENGAIHSKIIKQ